MAEAANIGVIGGGVSQAWDLFIDRTKLEVKIRGLKAPAERVKIVRSALGGDEGMLGASYLALNPDECYLV